MRFKFNKDNTFIQTILIEIRQLVQNVLNNFVHIEQTVVQNERRK